MFHHEDPHRAGRHRHGDERVRMAHELREELRRNFGHRGPQGPAGFREMFGPGRRGMVRRGEVRPLILRALRDRPMHGYELIQQLESQSGGRWRPSAGSIYPTLQQLADEGLVSGSEVDGRRVYTLTDAGRKAAESSAEPKPWADAESGDARDEADIYRVIPQLAAAAVQVAKVGSPDTRREATKILTDARKQLYRLLSEDADESAETEA